MHSQLQGLSPTRFGAGREQAKPDVWVLSNQTRSVDAIFSAIIGYLEAQMHFVKRLKTVSTVCVHANDTAYSFIWGCVLHEIINRFI